MFEEINKIFGITESYQLPDRLREILFDKKERERVFESLLKIDNDLSHDILRDYFQQEHGDRDKLKQDYTPDCVCEIVASLADGEKVSDLCAGTGALTVAKWTKNKQAEYCCYEFSARAFYVLLLNMAIRNINGVIVQCNILSKEIMQAFKLTAGERFSDIEKTNYEEQKCYNTLVITNPPYSMKWENVDNFQNDERFIKYGLPPKKASDYAFILDGLHRLNEQGSLVAILPHGVLFRGGREEEIRKRLIADNLIDGIIGLPDKLFMNTTIPVCIMILKKGRTNKNIFICDASREYEAGGKQNTLNAEQINKIIQAYKNRKEISKFSHIATLQEIIGNSYNLNIPRYVDTYEPEPVPDILETMTDLMKIKGDISQTESELVEMLGDLVCNDESEAGSFYSAVSMLQEYEAKDKKRLSDVGTLERMVNGKDYSVGTIMFELSATKGIVKYCHTTTKGDGRYAALIVNKEHNPYYIYQSIDFAYPEFISKYKTTINLQYEALQELKFTVHRSRKKQDSIATELLLRERELEREQQQLEMWKNIKKYFLDKLFPNMPAKCNQQQETKEKPFPQSLFDLL